jgi:hypothetical protein
MPDEGQSRSVYILNQRWVFQDGRLAAIFDVRSGQNSEQTDGAQIHVHTRLEHS